VRRSAPADADCGPPFILTMLITLNRQLRRHRRRVLTALAVLAVALAALSAHAALMRGALDGHAISDATTSCLIVGGSLAIAGVAVLAVRRLQQRLWLVAAPPMLALGFVPAYAGFAVRAAPPPLLQVFRL
jgi:hypothetical protein